MFCVENAVSLGKNRFLYSKYDFAVFLGRFFDTFLSKVGPFVKLSIRCPFGRPFFRFHGHLGSQLGRQEGARTDHNDAKVGQVRHNLTGLGQRPKFDGSKAESVTENHPGHKAF